MRRRPARLAALAALLLLVALAPSAAAAPASVTIASFAFDPKSVTITAGETVTWTNLDRAAHSAALTGGGPKTKTLANGESDSLKFTAAGTYPYVCGIHGSSMSGTVVVVAAAPPPTAPPTPVPTPVPTTRLTPPPTATPEPTPLATPSPPATAAATAAPSVAVAKPTEQAAAPAASDSAGPPPLVIGAGAIVVIGLVAFAIARLRR
jgi:plastocyanin